MAYILFLCKQDITKLDVLAEMICVMFCIRYTRHKKIIKYFLSNYEKTLHELLTSYHPANSNGFTSICKNDR